MSLNINIPEPEKETYYIEVEAVWLKKLAKSIGAVRTADLVGYSPSAINASLRSGRCRKTLEIAAEKVYGDVFQMESKYTMMVVCDERTRQTIQHICMVASAKCIDVEA